MLLGLGLNRGVWDGVEVWAELFGRSARQSAGGGRRRYPGQGGGGAVPGQRLLHQALGRRKATGETEARPQRNHQELKLATYHEAIAAEVAQRPDVTLNELRAWLLMVHDVSASLGLMHRTLARLGLTLKKSRSGQKSRTGLTLPSNAPFGGPDNSS